MRDEDVTRLPPAKRRKVYEAKAGAAPCWFRHLGVYAVADVYGLPELAEAATDNVGLSICPPPAVRLGSESRAILAYLAGEGAEAFGDCEDLHEMLAEAVVAHPLNFSADDIERPGLSLRLRCLDQRRAMSARKCRERVLDIRQLDESWRDSDNEHVNALTGQSLAKVKD